MSIEFLSSLGGLGFIPRSHNNQPEDRAGKNGEIDSLATMYANKGPNLNFYQPTQRDSTDAYIEQTFFGTVTNIPVNSPEESKFPFQVGLRFFPTVRPIEEILYGDAQ